MTKKQLKKYMQEYKKDSGVLKHELVKFLSHIYKVFNYQVPDPDNDYSRGFQDGIRQVESEIFEDEK